MQDYTSSPLWQNALTMTTFKSFGTPAAAFVRQAASFSFVHQDKRSVIIWRNNTQVLNEILAVH